MVVASKVGIVGHCARQIEEALPRHIAKRSEVGGSLLYYASVAGGLNQGVLIIYHKILYNASY